MPSSETCQGHHQASPNKACQEGKAGKAGARQNTHRIDERISKQGREGKRGTTSKQDRQVSL